MAAAAKFQAPKGTRDFYPGDMALRRRVEAAWRSASIAHGYEEIEGPTFEHLELYTQKSGPGIVSELFSFRRAGGENDYALRPEFTPTLARMVASRAASLPMPLRWFAVPVHFRAERPQRGRLREFVQWNVDLLGAEGEAADAEVISTALLALERLGLSPRDVRVRASHRASAAAMLAALGVPAERAGDAFDLLDRRGRLPAEEFARRAAELRLDADAFARLDAVAGRAIPLADAPRFLDELRRDLPAMPASTVEPLAALASALRAADLEPWCDLDLGIVRGLAYYTGTVFEIHDTQGAERAVAGGGRYDGLVELFGGPRIPAVGFGMGDVVLSLMLHDRGLLPKDGAELLPRPDVFLVAGSPEGASRLASLATQLRRDGLHVRHSHRATHHVGKLLGEAAKARARCAVILGRELEQGLVALKDLDSGAQTLIPAEAIRETLRARRDAPPGGMSSAPPGAGPGAEPVA